MTATPVTITITEINGPRTLTWSRADRADLTDLGRWDGSDDWVRAANSALATRLPVLVAQPDLHYEFGQFDGSLLVEEIAAAMIAVGGPRGDCGEAIDELPDALFVDDDIPDDAIF